NRAALDRPGPLGQSSAHVGAATSIISFPSASFAARIARPASQCPIASSDSYQPTLRPCHDQENYPLCWPLPAGTRLFGVLTAHAPARDLPITECHHREVTSFRPRSGLDPRCARCRGPTPGGRPRPRIGIIMMSGDEKDEIEQLLRGQFVALPYLYSNRAKAT